MLRQKTLHKTVKTFGPDVLAGLIVATIGVAYCVGFAALIFEGAVSDGLPLGLWSMLAGTAVACIAIGLMTSLPPMVATQEAIAIGMLKVVSVGIVSSSLAAGASAEQTIANVMAGLILSSLLGGGALLLVGTMGVGQMLRFIPSPVTGGFLCATGLVIFDAAFRMMTGQGVSAFLINPAIDWKTVTSVAMALGFFAAILWLRKCWTSSPLLLPCAFIACTLSVLALHWLDIFQGGLTHWFPAETRRIAPWFLLTPQSVATVDWRVIADNSAVIAAVPFVLVVSLAVRTAAFEAAFNRTANFDTEFRAHGIAALAAGLTGGTMAAAAQGPVRLMHELGVKGAVPAITAVIVIALLLLAGMDLTAYFPIPLLAGLLLVIGWGILLSALEQPLRQKAWAEIAVIALILAVSLNVGFFAGVIVGFAVSSILFVVKYSQVPVIRRQMTRRSFASHVARASADERILQERGSTIRLYWLAGYLFFGSSHRVVSRIREEIDRQEARSVKFVVIDFSGVTGIDSAAVKSLDQLARHCSDNAVTITCSGLTDATSKALRESGLLKRPHLEVAFANHNEALAWCEDQTLEAADRGRGDSDFVDWVAREIGHRGSATEFLEYLTVRGLPAGAALYEEGTPADTIDIIANGKVSIVVSVAGRPHEVRRMEQHTIVGEMGFFRKQTRSASVVAIDPVTIYQLDRASFDRMRSDSPALASALVEFLIRTLSDRLEFANGAIRGLVEPAQ